MWVLEYACTHCTLGRGEVRALWYHKPHVRHSLDVHIHIVTADIVQDGPTTDVALETAVLSVLEHSTQSAREMRNILGLAQPSELLVAFADHRYNVSRQLLKSVGTHNVWDSYTMIEAHLSSMNKTVISGYLAIVRLTLRARRSYAGGIENPSCECNSCELNKCPPC